MFRSKPTVGSVCGGICYGLTYANLDIATRLHRVTRDVAILQQTVLYLTCK